MDTELMTQFRCGDCGIAFWIEIDEDSRQIECTDCGSENTQPIDFDED